MRSLLFPLGWCLAAIPSSEAFQTSRVILSRQHQFATSSSTTLFSGYLSSLSRAAPIPSFSATFPAPSPTPNNTPPSFSSPSSTSSTIEHSKTFLHASLDYFGIPNLTPKGPRKNADVGQPHDSSRALGNDGAMESGSWWCAAGGWPSLQQRSTTEIFFVLSGHGCLTDLDGMRHYFGPGDTVILPKGWSGRWDVLEDMHKVWFVHDHPHSEVNTTHRPVRVQIANYHTLFAPQHSTIMSHGARADAIHGTPCTTSKTLYDVGPTAVGVWTCTPGSFPVRHRPTTECFHVLEGVFFLTNAKDNTARRCVAGDTVILPKGWSGYWDVIEPVKKLWCVV